ncbi:hypothetical protein [Nocardioides sp.]|uniref:hypothetical protein n=1 Tax=Nocardioides sp. TaxID=35761 RepID=UPI002D038A6F|nr:hypothetical protein [Nocardioides sp.]HXH80006.1 hypothetical protein [Nocardioides sp.]
MRTTGVWTTFGGEQRQVAGRVDGPTIRLRDRFDPTRLAEHVAAEQLGEVVAVTVRASWRGGEVLVNRLRGDDAVTFLTDDRALAEREGLQGDQYSGWGGIALMQDLSSVEETVTVLRGSEGHA